MPNKMCNFLENLTAKFVSKFHTKLTMDTKGKKRFFAKMVSFVSSCEISLCA